MFVNKVTVATPVQGAKLRAFVWIGLFQLQFLIYLEKEFRS